MIGSRFEYIPTRGDIINIDFEPQVGIEINKRRFSLVISHSNFNKRGLVLVCPITTTIYNTHFEVKVPETPFVLVRGVILCNQLKSLDWLEREAKFKCRVPITTVTEVANKIKTILKRH
jgi:mRNA interferase MazF